MSQALEAEVSAYPLDTRGVEQVERGAGQHFDRIPLLTKTALRASVLIPEAPISETAFMINHGFSSTGDHYQEMLEALARMGYYAIEHSPDRSLSIEDFLWRQHPVLPHVENAIEVIDAAKEQAGITRVHPIGHSFGGLTALNLVVNKEVESATLAGTSGLANPSHDVAPILFGEAVPAALRIVTKGPKSAARNSLRHFVNVLRTGREFTMLANNPDSSPYIKKALAQGALVGILGYGKDKIFLEADMKRVIAEKIGSHEGLKVRYEPDAYHVNPNDRPEFDAALQASFYRQITGLDQAAA